MALGVRQISQLAKAQTEINKVLTWAQGAVESGTATAEAGTAVATSVERYRSAVLEAISGKLWLTIKEISDKTGVAIEKVRRVVNAADTRDRIERAGGYGDKKYHYVGKEKA
jgi:hypothetical protein